MRRDCVGWFRLRGNRRRNLVLLEGRGRLAGLLERPAKADVHVDVANIKPAQSRIGDDKLLKALLLFRREFALAKCFEQLPQFGFTVGATHGCTPCDTSLRWTQSNSIWRIRVNAL